MPFITQGKANLKYILIVVVLAVIVGGGILWLVAERNEQPSSSPQFTQYNLIYCFGDSDAVSEIEVIEGRVIEPIVEGKVISPIEKEGLAPEKYWYKCYLLDTRNFSQEELTVQEINKFMLITTEVSPDGSKIITETVGPKELLITGIINRNIFLSKDSTKKLIAQEKTPVTMFRLIGWAATKETKKEIEKQTNGGGWSIYKNNEFGFQFEYPAGWEISEVKKEERKDTLAVAVINSESFGSIYVWDYSQLSVEEIQSIVTEKEDYISPLGGKVEFDAIEIKQISVVNGIAAAIQMETRASREGQEKVTQDYYLIPSPKGKNLLLQVSLDNELEGKKVWERLINTFKFLD